MYAIGTPAVHAWSALTLFHRYVSIPCLARRGASAGDAGLMEQAGRSAGDQAEPSGAFAAHATNAARRLRVRPRQPGTRAVSGPAFLMMEVRSCCWITR